jgi:tetratricopeptide (TPR) repeat protein
VNGTVAQSTSPASSGVASAAAAETGAALGRAPEPQPVIGGRYAVINMLGRGAAGSVYRVLDRLTGRVVTLKLLRPPGPDADHDSVQAERLGLAQEFRLLASLHHPNVIGVLDYGYESQQPYFTMDLKESALNLVEAARDRPLALQVDLLVQTLRALAYIGRRGIIHRDVKPGNVLVIEGQVKLLDFGLSVYQDTLRDREPAAGTVAYLAPEVIRGAAPSVRSDLFSFGVLMYEAFTNRHPFDIDDPIGFLDRLLSRSPPMSVDGLDPRLEPVLLRLLAKRPEDRFPDPATVVAAIGKALNQPIALETATSRESFIQAAAFVGRQAELGELKEALSGALAGHGGACLVGGESGVGKSRLLEELCTHALVDGGVAARSRASRVGGEPYEIWREVVRTVVLRVPDLDERLASDLKPLVPDIGELLGRPIGDPPSVDAEAAQTRLIVAVTELFRLQPRPVVVLLDDLQWAGSESIRMLAACARAARDMHLLVVGAYRDDEKPDLPAAIGGARELRLRRLATPEVEHLAASMIGAAGRGPRLVERLERETEGNPFFLVEVVRALAEEAGALERITEGTLLGLRVPDGIQRLLRRRLARVTSDMVPPLKLAAVIGREVDAALLQALQPGLALSDWTRHCASAGVLESHDDRVSFAHDKLRDQLLADIDGDERRTLHQSVAQAIEQVYQESTHHLPALAHHWGAAGDRAREARYAERAGFLAQQSGACQEAIEFFERALLLVVDDLTPAERVHRVAAWPVSMLHPGGNAAPGETAFRLARLEAGLAECHFRLGDSDACRHHAIQMMRLCGIEMPKTRAAFLRGIAQQLLRRITQVLVRYRSNDERAGTIARELVHVQSRLVETYFFSLDALPLLWVTILMANLCAPFGASPELGKTYMVLALIASGVPARRFSRRWCARSVRIGDQVCAPSDLAYLLTRVNNSRFADCEWDTADPELARAAELGAAVGDRRVWEEARSMQGMSALFQGRFADGVEAWAEAQRSCERSDNWQIECWALMGQADNFVRLGRDEDAVALYQRALDGFADRASTTERIWAYGMLALACARLDRRDDAVRWADEAMTLVNSLRPVAYWTQHGTAAAAEAFLTLAETESSGAKRAALLSKAERACGGLRRFARAFRLGQPFALLCAGLEDWLAGREARAMKHWRRCIRLAERLRTPYELGRAHFEIGRHLAGADRRAHLERAATLFEKQGAARDLTRVHAELARDDRVRLAG